MKLFYLEWLRVPVDLLGCLGPKLLRVLDGGIVERHLPVPAASNLTTEK